jgi:ribosomal protein L32
MADSPTERKRRQRARERGDLPDLPVCSCGKRIRSGRQLCSRCWLKTDEGREWQRQRVQSYRLRNGK